MDFHMARPVQPTRDMRITDCGSDRALTWMPSGVAIDKDSRLQSDSNTLAS